MVHGLREVKQLPKVEQLVVGGMAEAVVTEILLEALCVPGTLFYPFHSLGPSGGRYEHPHLTGSQAVFSAIL